MKSLYYCRSMSIQRAEASVGATSAELNAEVITSVEGSPRLPLAVGESSNGANYEECLSCQ